MRQNCDQIPHTSSFPHLMGQWVWVSLRHCSVELWPCASSPLHRCFPLLTRTLFTHTEEQHCFKCEECRPPAAGTDRPRSPCLSVCIKPHCTVYSTQTQGTAHGFNISATFMGWKEPRLVLRQFQMGMAEDANKAQIVYNMEIFPDLSWSELRWIRSISRNGTHPKRDCSPS